MINILEINYRDYGKCLNISNGMIEIIVTLDCGPRIIRYGYVDGNNHLAEYINDRIVTPYGDYFVIGGHRFSNDLYVPDNEKVEYELILNGVRLMQKVEKWTQIQKSIDITFTENSSEVTILHRTTSFNVFNINLFISSITSMKKGGIEIIPFSRKSENILPDRMFVLWPYSNLRDSRVYFGDRYVAMKVNENILDNFKIGFNTNFNHALYYNDEELFIKYYEKNNNNLNYPHMGCNYESFICKNYIEMQSNSPIYNVKPNDHVEYLEIWKLHRGITLDSLDKFIDNC